MLQYKRFFRVSLTGNMKPVLNKWLDLTEQLLQTLYKMKYANNPERLSLLRSLPPNGKAFLTSLWQNFSMRRRSQKNICQRSIIIAWRLWWSFLCSRVFFCMIPIRFGPQNCVLMKNVKRNCFASRREDATYPCDAIDQIGKNSALVPLVKELYPEKLCFAQPTRQKRFDASFRRKNSCSLKLHVDTM